MRYNKKLLIKDLEHKIKQIEELEESLVWILDHYKKGELPD